MNRLPTEEVQLIYTFDGRYKRFMDSCFSIIGECLVGWNEQDSDKIYDYLISP